MEMATTPKQLPPDFKNYRSNTKKGKKRNPSKAADDSDEFMLEEEDDNVPAIPPTPMEKDSDILGNSLSGMSKDEIAKHHELCMRLAAENKITSKNSFGLHLISIMNQMVKDCPDLQQASLSLAASSKIYCGRVEALYKDTFQFHSNLQTMLSTGKKSKKDDVESNNDEEANEKGRSRHNKAKSYLTSHESISLDSKRNASKMPHSNFVVINSAFSASRAAKKLLSLPLESDSNKIAFASSSCYRLRQPISSVPYDAHRKLTELFDKVCQLEVRCGSFEDMDASSNVFFQPGKCPSPPQDFDTMNDGAAPFSPVMEDNNDMGAIIDRFSVMNITADAFTQDLYGAVTSGNTVDVQKLPTHSALKTVLQSARKLRSTVKQKKEVKPKESFFSKDLQIHTSLFKADKKKKMQAATTMWCPEETSVFFSNEQFLSSIRCNSKSEPEQDREQCGIRLPSCFASDTEKKEHFRTFYLKHSEVCKKQRLSSLQNLRMRPSSLGMVLGDRDRSNDPSENLAQSFGDLSLHDSFCEKPAEYDASPLPVQDSATALDEGNCDSPGLPEVRDSDLFADAHLSEVSESYALERDVKSLMVTPPELVKPVNIRYEMVPNSINMERAKDLLWGVISGHLEKEKSVLLSKAHRELDLLMKCTPSEKSSKTSPSEGISLQFAFVILLLLANEKGLLIENIADSDDLIIKQDVFEMDSSEVF